jgi:ESCRT-II complex subunit VPS36
LGDLLLVLSSGSDASDVLSALQRVLERKEWTKSTTQTLEQAKRLTSHRVGVDAVLAKSRIVHRQEQRISDEALAATDADELLREAAELARIIRKHVAVLERNSEIGSAAPPSSDGGVVDPESERALARMLQDMGMASALSKKDTSDYYGTVARQLADLLLPRMEGLGGIITLTDVYCLLNRARSTHLLSPEDLLRATQELEGIGVGLRVRTFRSGLVVLQDARVDDDRLAEMLRDACAGAGAGASSAGAYSMGGGMTALDASGLLNTTPLLAEEQLCWAEERGYLARDEQVETVRFYPNLFGEFAEAAAAQAAAASSSTGASPGGP